MHEQIVGTLPDGIWGFKAKIIAKHKLHAHQH